MSNFADTPLHNTPLATVAQEMAANGWPLQPSPDQPAIFTAFAGKNGDRRAILVYEPGPERILVYTMMFDEAPVHQRVRLLQLLTRINYGLGTGCFEMDLDDGEIRYRVTIPAEMAMPHRLIPALIDACMTVDTYAPTFASVAAGADPRSAIAELQALLG